MNHPIPWRVFVEGHRVRGLCYHVQDAIGADVCVLEIKDDDAAEETAQRIVDAVNAGGAVAT